MIVACWGDYGFREDSGPVTAAKKISYLFSLKKSIY